MGRTLMYTALGALALLILSSTFVLEHGGGTLALEQEASLHDLTTNVDEWRGRSVSTTGTLYHNDALDQYQISDGDQNFPVVVRWNGGMKLLVGKKVTVLGKFSDEAGIGPVIDARSVRLTVDPNGSTPTPTDI
jgi:hypothetical protein